MTLKRAILKGLAKASVANAVVAVAFFSFATSVPTSNGADLMDSRPHAPGSVAGLMQSHDCWTGDAPADVTVPGHVIVTRDGFPVYGGSRLVGLAFEQVFDGVDHDLEIHAFCR